MTTRPGVAEGWKRGPWVIRPDTSLAKETGRASWGVYWPKGVFGKYDVTACAYLCSREQAIVVRDALSLISLPLPAAGAAALPFRMGPLVDVDTDLLTRLWEAARDACAAITTHDNYAFTPEQVARGLERMRDADGCGDHGDVMADWTPRPGCDACWPAMLDAFIAGARGDA